MDPAVAGRHFVDQGRKLRLDERRRRLARGLLRAPALLAAAVGAPDVLPDRNFGHRPPGRHAGHAIVDERIAVVGLSIAVGDLLEHPRLGLLAGLRLQAEHHPFALHPLTLEREVEMAFLDRLARVLARVGDPPALVPQHHRPAAIFALGNGALKRAIVERMVLGPHRQPVLAGVQARPLGNRPALEHAVELQPEVPMEPRGVVLLDDEAVAFALEPAALGLLRLREIALPVVGLDVERNALGHG